MAAPVKRPPPAAATPSSSAKKAPRRGDDIESVAPADSYLVKVHDALSAIMGNPAFHKIVAAPPLGIKVEAAKKSKTGGGFKDRTRCKHIRMIAHCIARDSEWPTW